MTGPEYPAANLSFHEGIGKEVPRKGLTRTPFAVKAHLFPGQPQVFRRFSNAALRGQFS
jgi:hypothetical protein